MSDVLQRGASGPEVVELQKNLRQLNFYSGALDGDFGPGTEAALVAYREWRGFDSGVDADENLVATLAADAQTYGSGAGEISENGEAPEVEVDDPNAAVRQAAISAAWGEIGQVRAKNSGGTDETGQETRDGWERLMEYFHVAAPGIWSDDVIKYLKPGLPSWCGIFTLWALKTGGAGVGDWGMGTGIPGIRQVRDPKPGDIGYIEQNQHYCLIVSVEGDTVYSIDGNTVGDDTGGGEVNDRTRSRGDYAGFFTVFN
ncbi:MAG TPA: peptidoglycan-binding domain-containing protein [Actinophytocola sp.]|uniref:peptidoglycan-binding domain-containing protein n=1 Tax=Actinophytocola sp. TaxID=1872138 RepID=UPI002DDD7383|nr:peptidoglycan-binding domain-containing protein [Actinophytocola sp.]HEV2780464.1 peptidoglycan-binding domain-containing protein [Actinophytocola sp.]